MLDDELVNKMTNDYCQKIEVMQWCVSNHKVKLDYEYTIIMPDVLNGCDWMIESEIPKAINSECTLQVLLFLLNLSWMEID